jgi:hypothetical protein
MNDYANPDTGAVESQPFNSPLFLISGGIYDVMFGNTLYTNLIPSRDNDKTLFLDIPHTPIKIYAQFLNIDAPSAAG